MTFRARRPSFEEAPRVWRTVAIERVWLRILLRPAAAANACERSFQLLCSTLARIRASDGSTDRDRASSGLPVRSHNLARVVPQARRDRDDRFVDQSAKPQRRWPGRTLIQPSNLAYSRKPLSRK